jgi:hypothetical protein
MGLLIAGVRYVNPICLCYLLGHSCTNIW